MDAAAELTALQKMFHVTALGGGDPVVGFNLLASMACTLANLAPDDGTVVHPDATPARLGTSLLVFGSASAGRVVDEIVTEICRRQNNLISHLRSYFAFLDEIKGKPGATPPPSRRDEGRSVNLIAETQSEIGDLYKGVAGSWWKVLEQVPDQTIREIRDHPKFLVSVGGRKDLESQLSRLRPGCPLVHLGLSHPGDLALFSGTGLALLEGRYPLDDSARTVKGNILITDPMRVLIAAAQNPDDQTLWLGHVLWLTDGDSGPDAPDGEPGGTPESGALIEDRFRKALGKLMVHRLGWPGKAKMTLVAGIRRASARWSGFLREMEPRLPGISGAARNLPASLAFGLGLMAPKPDMISADGVEAMARFLVRRMANVRIAILHSGEVARRRDQIRRVFHKLGGGPADERRICRDLKIAAADRDDALRWLEEAKLVFHRRNEWERCDGARLSFTECSVPILEV